MAHPVPVLAALAVTAAAAVLSPRPGAPPSAAPVATGYVADDPAPTTSPWTWPVAPPVQVLRGFDPPAQRWSAGHRGVDLASSSGDEVRAAAAGVIAFVGMIAGRGVVTVRHGTLRTTYEPVRGILAVGHRVDAGEPIARLELGTGHCSSYPTCLHWGLRRAATYLDPLQLMQQRYAVLLPFRPD